MAKSRNQLFNWPTADDQTEWSQEDRKAGNGWEVWNNYVILGQFSSKGNEENFKVPTPKKREHWRPRASRVIQTGPWTWRAGAGAWGSELSLGKIIPQARSSRQMGRSKWINPEGHHPGTRCHIRQPASLPTNQLTNRPANQSKISICWQPVLPLPYPCKAFSRNIF